MKKIVDNIKKLFNKIRNAVIKFLNSSFFKFLMIPPLLWFFLNCFNCFDIRNSNTAYAYSADIYETNQYSMLNGGFTIQSAGSLDNRFYSITGRNFVQNLSYEVSGEGDFLYFNFAPQYLIAGHQSLVIEFDQIQVQDEFITFYCDYVFTYRDGSTFYTRDYGIEYTNINPSNGYVIDILAEIEGTEGIPYASVYRLDYFVLGFYFNNQTGALTFNGNVTARNSSTFTYNDYVNFARSFDNDYKGYLTTTVADTFNTIVETQNSLLSLELFPNFTIGSLLLLILTIPVVIFIAKLFLGG